MKQLLPCSFIPSLYLLLYHRICIYYVFLRDALCKLCLQIGDYMNNINYLVFSRTLNSRAALLCFKMELHCVITIVKELPRCFCNVKQLNRQQQRIFFYFQTAAWGWVAAVVEQAKSLTYGETPKIKRPGVSALSVHIHQLRPAATSHTQVFITLPFNQLFIVHRKPNSSQCLLWPSIISCLAIPFHH